MKSRLSMTLEPTNNMTQDFAKNEERSAEKQDKILEMVEKQIKEAISRQNAQMRAQLEEVYAVISRMIDEKLDNFKNELTEPKKKSKGVFKPQSNEDDSP